MFEGLVLLLDLHPLHFLHSKHQLQLQLPQQGQIGIVLKGLGIQKLWFRVLWLLEVQHPLHNCLCLICITFIVGFEAQIAARLGRAFRAGVIARLHLDGEYLGTECSSRSITYTGTVTTLACRPGRHHRAGSAQHFRKSSRYSEFCFSRASGSSNPTIAVCFVVYVRQAVPNSVKLQESIVNLGGESSVEPMLFAVGVDIETLRGDGAGQHKVVLVDLP